MNRPDPSPEYQQEQVQRLFIQHMSELKAWVCATIRDRTVADDIIQEVFLTAYKKADQYQLDTNFRAWVYAIARFKILEACRRPAIREVCLEAELMDLILPQPEEVLADRERLKALARCVEKLSPRSREAVLLRYMKEKKPPAIAEIMNWSVGAVNVALSRSRVALRNCINRQPEIQGLTSKPASS